MANPIVHFEIMGNEDQKAQLQAFYRDTFDCEIQPMGDMQYGMVIKPEGEVVSFTVCHHDVDARWTPHRQAPASSSTSARTTSTPPSRRRRQTAPRC